MDYIVASANLFAQTYDIEKTRDLGEITRTLQAVSVPDFTPRSSMWIHTTDEKMQDDKEGVDNNELEVKLASSQSFDVSSMNPFEKVSELEYTLWHHFPIQGFKPDGEEMTVTDLLDHFKIAGFTEAFGTSLYTCYQHLGYQHFCNLTPFTIANQELSKCRS
ncbi:ubiquitin-like modifier-activating enzyme 1 [Polyodon spathula]|uniref:ubiquitin-like modifier-activating enzyme 1 n=1 Tax=Polyodon spathula TaxID=7913 RepID=UPI001B7ED2DD|nr:ubiquitin-like modifier-activating enzyme 1 [Polyodon spathula]